MKRTHAIIIFGFLGILLFVSAGANIVSATLTNTSECGTTNCHDSNTAIIINSDVTGTVNANVDEDFTISIDATGGAKLLRIEKPWANNVFFDYSTQLVHDNEAGDTDAAADAISAEITVTPLSGGDYTIRIWVAGEPPEANYIDISVSVEGATTGFTTTEPVDPQELVNIWYTLMYILIPSIGILMVVLAIFVIRRSD